MKTEKSTSGIFPYSADIGDVVTSLSHVNRAELTSERYSEITAILHALADEGVSSLPALRSLLGSVKDISFLDVVKDPNLVEYDSLRLGLFDTLRQIGGPEAESVLFDELQRTGNPVEIATLAGYLDELSPETYSYESVLAAKSILELAQKGYLEGQNIGPLFHVLQEYGDARVLADLEQNMDTWGHYVTVALAGIADDAGIPVLIDMVQSRSGDDWGRSYLGSGDKGLVAMQMLAQSAIDSPGAYEAILEQSESNRIPDGFWPAIASVLAGDDQLQLVKPDIARLGEPYSWSSVKKYSFNEHSFFGDKGQTLTMYSRHYSAVLSPDEAEARIAMIDEMLSVTDNPAAVQALENARDLLTVHSSR